MQIIDYNMKLQLPNKAISTERSRSGFTLIELLVVIAIIAILATIGFAVFSGITQRGNDAKRQTDIKSIADVYEIKRTGGDYGGVALAAPGDFSAGIIPTDPVAAKRYCFRTGTAAVPAAVANTDITTAGCAGGAGNGSTAWNEVGTTALAVGTAYFRVCALNQLNAATVCVGSKQ